MGTDATRGDGNSSAGLVHDVVVIGGGPAGAAVARGLALHGRDVVLLEATEFDGPRFGETLPPEANPLLRELGVWDAFVASGALESPGTISAWGPGPPRETDFVGNRHGGGWHVDRNAFDALLCEAASDAGACVVTGSRAIRCTRDQDGTWRVEVRAAEPRSRTAESPSSVRRARFVVDASGRTGIRLRDDDRRKVDDVLVGIFLRIAHDTPPSDLRTLVESAPDGWWYCAPLPSGETAAVFLTDPQLYANEGIVPGEHLAAAPLTRARIGAGRIVGSHAVNVPSSARAQAAGDAWAAAGDAAAAYDPLSGYGITKALNGALRLSEAVHRALEGDQAPLFEYVAAESRAFEAYARQRRTYYRAETRWPERIFWKRRRT